MHIPKQGNSQVLIKARNMHKVSKAKGESKQIRETDNWTIRDGAVSWYKIQRENKYKDGKKK